MSGDLRTLRAVAVSALALVTLPLGGAAPVREIRAMTFNIRYGTAPDGPNAWENRRGLVLEAVKAFDPDVLGLQECLRFQADYLAEQLPAYAYVAAGRNDGRDAGEMCAVFYRRDRFGELGHGHFWLSGTPDSVGSRGWDAALPRMATWVRLRAHSDTLGGFLVVNTHFDHQGAVARLESARLVSARTGALRERGPAIVMGDFNAPADPDVQGPYAELLSGAGGSTRAFIDTYRAANPDPSPREGTFHAFEGQVGGGRVDWILVTPGVRVIEGDIDRRQRAGRYPSDHFPVTAVLRIPARSRE